VDSGRSLLRRIRSLVANVVDKIAPRAFPPGSPAARLQDQAEAEQADVRAQIQQGQKNYPLQGLPRDRARLTPGARIRAVMTKPVSPFLSTATIVVCFAALVGAAIAGFSALVVLLGLALAVALITKLWSHLCLKGVSCERRLNERRVFPGDEVLLSLRVVNRKPLPLPWVEVHDQVPAALIAATTTTNEGAGPPSGLVTLSRSTPLRWYSAASFTQRLDSSARGYYPLGPLSVISGDIFGLHPRDLVQPDIDHLVVYPRTYPLRELGIPSLSHLGDSRSRLRVFDDPSRLVGVRGYEPGDSLRRIHWKASARSGALQVKLFEFTTDLKVAVFLGIDTFAGRPRDDLELGISTAASVARHLLERDVQTGLFVNTRQADTQLPVCIAAGTGTTHLALVLEALAKTTAEADGAFVDFFERRRADLGFGGTLVFVVGDVSPAIDLMTTDLKRQGRQVLGFEIATDGREPRRPGLDWHRVHRGVA
jgi:uncharacterized protein (DUF58 family)